MIKAKTIIAALMVTLTAAALFSGCAKQSDSAAENTVPETTVASPVTKLPKLDMSKWAYNADSDMYYQLGIIYCETPADESYEQLAVFVPGTYMSATDNGDGTFTCALTDKKEENGYTAGNAPIVMPINTEGYAAAEPLTKEVVTAHEGILEEIAEYTSQGFVYVCAGCRGINEGAPLGAADLKAAIRYIRYCDDVIAGDAERIFVYGMSGGGALSSVLGASGDSDLYAPYLDVIGAVQGVSDAVAGVMAWCPITDLDTANAEYEWMMGCTRSGRTEEWNAISDKLAAAYADYVNSAGFTDENDNALTLEKSQKGIYQAGSYYDYVKSVIEKSLNNYLEDLADSQAVQEYVDSLNAENKWVLYDNSAKKATVTSVEDFVKTCKKASELPVAFDWPGSGNTLFGKSKGRGAHFDSILAGILTDINSEYAAEYKDDLKKTDSFGYTVEQRVNMYTPLHYLLKSRDGYGSSNVAKYWRIRTGIEQPTTSLTTEINLALALMHCDGVKSVDFETEWARTHEYAERSGDSTENFIDWVEFCTK